MCAVIVSEEEETLEAFIHIFVWSIFIFFSQSHLQTPFYLL